MLVIKKKKSAQHIYKQLEKSCKPNALEYLSNITNLTRSFVCPQTSPQLCFLSDFQARELYSEVHCFSS